jgi:hypothetical protein
MRLQGGKKMTIGEMQWHYNADGEIDLEKLRALCAYLKERDGDDFDPSHFLEKPGQYEEDWKEYQKKRRRMGA